MWQLLKIQWLYLWLSYSHLVFRVQNNIQKIYSVLYAVLCSPNVLQAKIVNKIVPYTTEQTRFQGCFFRQYNIIFVNASVIKGESGWCSGYHLHFPPLQPWIDSWGPHVGGDLSISIWLRGFFSGYSGFPPSLRLCSEVMHGPYSGSQGHLYMLLVRPCWAALPLYFEAVMSASLSSFLSFKNLSYFYKKEKDVSPSNASGKHFW